jgi:hypothetical protein
MRPRPGPGAAEKPARPSCSHLTLLTRRDLGQDEVGARVPLEGLWVGVVEADVLLNGARVSSATLLNVPRVLRRRDSSENHRCTRFSQDELLSEYLLWALEDLNL